MINSSVEQNMVPVIKSFLIKLYNDSGIHIVEDQIKVTGIKDYFVQINYSLNISTGSTSNSFIAKVEKSPSVIDVKATNNAVYDSFGNLLSPATQVTCTGRTQFRKTVNVLNSKTNQTVGTTVLPNNLNCDPSIDTCEVYGTAIIPL